MINIATITKVNTSKTNQFGNLEKRKKKRRKLPECKLKKLNKLKKKPRESDSRPFKMPRMLKLKRKESLKCQKVNGLETKKKLSPRKRQKEKNGTLVLFQISILLRKKRCLLRELDSKLQKLKECMKEQRKPKREQVQSIK